MKKITVLIALLVSCMSFSQDHKQKIQTYLNANLTKFDLSSKDVSDWAIESEVYAEGTKITSCYIVQRYHEIEIFNAQSNVSIKDGNVINIGNNFIKNIDQKINTTKPSITVIQAIGDAYSQLGITQRATFSIIETISDKKFKLSDGIQQEDWISARLVYQPTLDNKLKLAWAFQFYSPDGNHLWDVRIDALDGRILEKNDLKISCQFGNGNHKNHVAEGFNFTTKGFKNNTASMVDVVGGTYNVIPYNYESPSFSPFQLISSPAYLASSPYGWHDVNGIEGADFTITRGNNTRAYEDTNGDNSFGVSPDGGATLNFNFPYNGTDVQPSTNAAAATTNIFYLTNIMHDIWYQYGFDEPSGNFQQKNYTGTGTITPQGDYVLAESQDAYANSDPNLNNANFFTPADGVRPRMQMYLWTMGAPAVNYVTVNSPASIVGVSPAVTNNFEGTDRVLLPTAPNGITGDLVLYNNNPSNAHSGCQPPTNAAALSGKIVLIKRGGCEVNVKVKNAQNAGAIAVIVMDSIALNYENVPYGSTGLLGITIPAISVKKEKGDAWITRLNQGNTINMTLATPAGGPVYLFADCDFDNGIIGHEFGHGISNRLIGGPTNASCMTNAEQMGEGWSDWFALMLQIKVGDTGAMARPMGTYDTNEPNNGVGIRSVPYSTNMTICPLTLANSNITESHYRGEPWAAVLWDLTWAYIDKYGFDPDIYNGTGGNNKVMRLIIDALKLQACNTATFISGRDNIIAADQATTGGQNYCLITEVFRRRGMGLNASSGLSTSATDQIPDYTAFPPGPNCSLGIDYFKTEDLFRVYPNPSNGQFNVRINQFIGKINLQVIDMNGREVYNRNENDFNVEKSINLNYLQKGVYILKASNESLNYTEKIIIK